MSCGEKSPSRSRNAGKPGRRPNRGSLCHTLCLSRHLDPQTPRAQRSPVPRLKYGSLLHDFVFEFVHDRAGAPAVRLYDLCVCALQRRPHTTRITVHRDCPFNTVGVASNCSDSPGGWPRAGARVLHIRARAPPLLVGRRVGRHRQAIAARPPVVSAARSRASPGAGSSCASPLAACEASGRAATRGARGS